MNIPSESDWTSEPWGIDSPSAHKHFSGLSLAEAGQRFKERPELYCEDLQHMPAVCFAYYYHAFLPFVFAHTDEGNDIAHSYLAMIVRSRPHDIVRNAELLDATGKALAFVKQQQAAWYGGNRQAADDLTSLLEKSGAHKK